MKNGKKNFKSIDISINELTLSKDKTYLISVYCDQPVSYGELNAKMSQLKDVFQYKGLDRGNIIYRPLFYNTTNRVNTLFNIEEAEKVHLKLDI